MIETLKQVLEGVGAQLHFYATTYLPSTLAALILLLSAMITAMLARWVIYRIFKGRTIDKFLRQSGVAFLIDPSGRLRATRLVAETTYWGLLLAGVLMAISALNTSLTTQLTHTFILLLPKLVVAGFILLAGAWLAQYLGRSMLVWAVNEGMPSPRKLAALTRLILFFVAVVVAADHLDFARSVFLASFIILVGGAVLAASLAIGLGARTEVQRYLEQRGDRQSSNEESIWSHL